MNFQVGEQIVDIAGLKFWDNVLHYEKAIRSITKHTVTSANHKWFSIGAGVDVNQVSGLSNSWAKSTIYYQDRGDSLVDFRRVYNWTREEPLIRSKINEMFRVRFNKCTADDRLEIARLQNEIDDRQSKIDSVLAGQRPMSHRPDIIEREFLNARRSEVLAVLDSF